jgi:hypothetical protein
VSGAAIASDSVEDGGDAIWSATGEACEISVPSRYRRRMETIREISFKFPSTTARKHNVQIPTMYPEMSAKQSIGLSSSFP